MRNVLSRMSAVGVLLVLVLAACAQNKPAVTGSPTPTPSELPSVTLDECTTDQGTQEPAAPKGVDFKTQLKEQGVLNVGSDNDFPPFEEIPPGQKEPIGFNVDLYKEVAKRLGLTTKTTTTDFDALFTQSIPSGQFDVGISAITISEKRKRTVDFTIPYFLADLSVAVNAERTPGIATIDDLAGQTIGAQKTTTGEACAMFLVAAGKAKEVKSFGDTSPAFQDLIAGRIAAVINDRPASEGFIKKNASLKLVQVIKTSEQYGYAIGKEKPDLREAINGKLLEIMRDGTFATIYQKWFETPPPFALPLA